METTPNFPITLTEKAAEAVLSVMKTEGMNPEEKWLVVGIRGGGCSGFMYHMDFAGAPGNEDWFTDTQHGVKVCIDPISASHIPGTTIDYATTLMGAGFRFDNPTAQRHCGCGESFS